MIARSLNGAGVERFRAYLQAARGGAPAPPPRELLEDGDRTSELPVEIAIGDRRFRNRLDLGAYLCDRLAPLPAAELERDTGLWAWLSLFWFDQLCPQRPDGSRRPGVDYRHVPDFGYRTRYRHLLYGPYQVYRRHGAISGVLLSDPVRIYSQLYQAITGRQDLIANRGVVEAASLLYLDPNTGTLKRGCQPSQPHPGTVRRFVRVLGQLDVTFDVYGMSGPEILQVLPAEFDALRPAGGDALDVGQGETMRARP